MKKVLVPLANGVEEMEAVIIIDTFRRAQWKVTAAGIEKGIVRGSRFVRIEPDSLWEDIEINDFDMIVIPGGAGGTDRLCKDVRVINAIRKFHHEGKIIGAICAGPLVLKKAGILDGRQITCHPAVAEQLKELSPVEDDVVIDDNIITSRGPGTAFLFALSIISSVEGPLKADKLADAMIVARTEPYEVPANTVMFDD